MRKRRQSEMDIFLLSIRRFFAILKSMEKDPFEPIERLLRIIAHELYIARKDRELENAPKDEVESENPTDLQNWHKEERAWLANHIDHLREIADQSTRKETRNRD